MNPARLVFPALRWGGRTADQVWPEVHPALELGVGGFVVFGGSVLEMRELAVRALVYAGRPLLFAADLERGAGQQFGDATPLPPAAALGVAPDFALFESARITAQEAATAGIGWVLAPVVDLDVEPANPIVGTRSFGSDPAAVSDLARVWITGLQGEGVHGCAKHFPGHGRTTADSHSGLPVVAASRETLEADLAPFRAAVEAGVRSMMMAHVCYPAFDPSGTPASLSAPVIGLLRDDLGYAGLIATDAFIMEAIAASGRTEEQACVEAVRAGCDVLLYPASAENAVFALTAALEAGELPKERVAEAVQRVETAASTAQVSLDEPAGGSSHEEALKLASATLLPLRGSFPGPGPDAAVRLHILDDDLSSPAVSAAPEGVPRDRGRLAEALESRGVRLISPLSEERAVDVIAIFSEVRAWKNRAYLAPDLAGRASRLLEQAPDATLLLFGHPRLADQLPDAVNLICAWNGDPLMQEAAAARLMQAAP